MISSSMQMIKMIKRERNDGKFSRRNTDAISLVSFQLFFNLQKYFSRLDASGFTLHRDIPAHRKM